MPTEAPIYVVDDDLSVREAVGSLIRSAGLRVETFASAQEFLNSRWAGVPSCLVLDVQLPGLSGLDLQERLARSGGETSIVFLTGHADVPMSVRAMKAGAREFLIKPFAEAELLDAIRRALARHDVKRGAKNVPALSDVLIGSSREMTAVREQIAQVAGTDSTVLILGETGTGKELVARTIWRQSKRSSLPLISVNCAATPQALVASDLFGHEKGAFTGALQRRLGRFEQAEGGTIFIDEIGELPAETQVALLRVLQERTFERVGGDHPLTANVRVIAATNRDLASAIAAGSFRSDLFYRLNVFPIRVPPLRTCTEDIPLLVEHFLEVHAAKTGRRSCGIAGETLQRLLAYSWPGNVRELQNVIERSLIVCANELLTVDRRWLSEGLPDAPAGSESQPLTQTLTSRERAMIEAALAETRGVVSGQSGAAAKLRLPASTLESRIRALNIDKHRFKATY